MESNETVKALRELWKYSAGKSFGVKGLKEAEYICTVIGELPIAANLIETQNAKIEQLTKELEERDEAVKKLSETFEEFETEAKKALQINKALHKELDAAKADINIIEVDGLCSVCRFEDTCTDKNDCIFMYRGLTNE